MNRRAFASLVIAGIAGLASHAAAQGGPPPGRGPRWAQDAEKEFKVGPGMGPRLMTEDEWKEHRTKMQTLKGAELEAYRRATHEKMAARAKERGIEMGPGRGRGPAR
jgi:hypothetical protein